MTTWAPIASADLSKTRTTASGVRGTVSHLPVWKTAACYGRTPSLQPKPGRQLPRPPVRVRHTYLELAVGVFLSCRARSMALAVPAV
jgi:hypothetical protein